MQNRSAEFINNQRLRYIDALKGFLIVCVVTGHVILRSQSSLLGDHIFTFICSFQMPIFMLVSGFVNYKNDLACFFNWADIKKRFIALMLPFLMWGIVIRGIIDINLSVKQSISVIINPQVLWFIYALFFIYCIFYLLCWFANKVHIKSELMIALGILFLFGIFAVTNIRKFAFQFISYYFMFYSIGFFLRKYWIYVEKYLRYFFFISIPVFLTLAFHWKWRAPFVILNITIQNNLCLYAYWLITALFAIPFFMYIFKHYIREGWLLCELGKNTLGIYVVHGIINTRLTPLMNQFPYVIQVVLSTTSIIIICYFITKLLRKIPVIKTFLLGEIR
jgi:fucose 4-O-acetylase-like acetyltransferase